MVNKQVIEFYFTVNQENQLRKVKGSRLQPFYEHLVEKMEEIMNLHVEWKRSEKKTPPPAMYLSAEAWKDLKEAIGKPSADFLYVSIGIKEFFVIVTNDKSNLVYAQT